MIKTFLLIILFLTTSFTTVNAESNILYSNLVDQASQYFLKELLLEADIKKDNIDVFFDYVDLFNHSVENFNLVTNGFQPLPDNLIPYDEYKLSDRWLNSQDDFLGTNCRITTFDLLKDNISLNITENLDNSVTLFDNYALEAAPAKIFTSQERDAFNTFYAGIPAPLTKDIIQLQEIIENHWSQQNIELSIADNLSLISIYIHSSITPVETSLFIGHTGLLIEDEDGLYYLEKLAFDQPYQLLKVESRQSLYDYFMTKYDDSVSQPTSAPLILENQDNWWAY